jgi:hypothetical protein
MKRTSWMAVCLLASTLGVPALARAATFVVSNVGDTGPGSLRQAIFDANAALGPDDIAFAIAGAGPHVIAPATALPDLTGPVVLDGFTQAGPGTHAIVLDGTTIGGALSGLRLQAGAGGSTISGLVIHRFLNAIHLVNSADNRIFGCYLGLDATGSVAVGTQRSGVLLQGSQRNAIGLPGMGNVVSSNLNAQGNRAAIGVWLQAGSTDNTVQASYFGLDRSGTAPVGKPFSGVQLAPGATGNLIGGRGPGDGNVLSNGANGVGINGAHNQVIGNLIGTDRTGTQRIGNDYGVALSTSFGVINRNVTGNLIAENLISGSNLAGVALINGSTANTVRHNRIGTDLTGTAPIGNGINGVALAIGANDNLVEENLVAFNGATGILVASDSLNVAPPPNGNQLRSNAIHSNGDLGIDLSLDTSIPPIYEGPTLNDLLDADGGPNRLQNVPVLSPDCFRTPALVQVWGSLDSAPLTAYRIEVFTSREAEIIDVATPAGTIAFLAAEAESPNGAITVVTDASGHADFYLVAAGAAPAGDYLTATATDLITGDTSELSEAVHLGGAGASTAVARASGAAGGDGGVSAWTTWRFAAGDGED